MTVDAVIAMDDDEVLRRSEQLVPIGSAFLLDPYCLMISAPSSVTEAGKPTREQMEEATKKIVKVHTASSFWLGDICNLGDSLYGEEAAQFIDSEDIPEPTVRNLAWVAKQVPPTNRQIAPTWSHCQAVASLKADAQKEWLTKARQESWSVAKLKAEILKAGADTQSSLRWWLVVETGTEAKQEHLADQLEKDGFVVKKMSGVKKMKKPKKKKKEVTAKKRRGSKMSSTRRVKS